MSNKGFIKVISKLHIEVTPSTINHNPLFNQQISKEISNRTAIGISDASLKNNKIRGYWKITNHKNKDRMKNKIYHKD